MRRITVYFAAALLLIVGAILAAIPPDHRFTAAGGLELTGGGSRGPSVIEAWADGDAVLKFYYNSGSYYTGTTEDSFYVHTSGGDSLKYLRQDTPRRWYVSGKIDSLYADLDTATEVIVTWQ